MDVDKGGRSVFENTTSEFIRTEEDQVKVNPREPAPTPRLEL